MDNLDDYNRNSGQPKTLIDKLEPVFISVICLGVLFAVACATSGCYANPLAERHIKAEKINFTISSPWTTTTIQAEGWESDVKTQPIPAPLPSKDP